MGAVNGLKVLVVDDEALACERLLQLLADCGVEEAHGLTDPQAVAAWLDRHPADVVLLDISMPGMDGMTLARQLGQRPQAPALVFSTAHEQFAVEAFELNAADYLLKPVRRARLEEALQRAAQRRAGRPALSFSVRLRDRVLSIPLEDARYLKAELKYVTLVTHNGEYLLDEPLVTLEKQLGDAVLRIHRNCLVMRGAVQELRKQAGSGEELWVIRLRDIDVPLPVSRRQIPAIKSALGKASFIRTIT
ncbi:LytTR family DNA-binding domain-containing protein [Chromobacterium sp. IIBBL 290-4]|uniref:LytR/AlgR family response regulator transcription factor n=1 Tax=Chromobacterium sp. IIBBL 290-4 TaxID=2953890 RepID=UPI0020B72B0B|nr:LytTR family DNA-binding domain-containing protein [Chromobacterium sp. IIBBL 290-4]UTH75880.1 LytTR family DNA-binding domain-containing protein [Chromobacterium sp. IIBBL 290-4]